MIKELHVYLNNEPQNCLTNYVSTSEAINSNKEIIRTTQLHFLSFRYGYVLFVHYNNEVHHITLGKCEGTNREIRESTNIEKLLIAGEFDYF